MRAMQPLEDGYVERDGVKIYFEVFGRGAPTVLLMPTWSIVHSRLWKMQAPYLARHHRVVTFDGRGCGRSDRPAGPAAYADVEFAADAVAVMDETGTDAALVVGVSMGGGCSCGWPPHIPTGCSGWSSSQREWVTAGAPRSRRRRRSRMSSIPTRVGPGTTALLASGLARLRPVLRPGDQRAPFDKAARGLPALGGRRDRSGDDHRHGSGSVSRLGGRHP